MPFFRYFPVATLAIVLLISAHAAPWWYVAHDEFRAMFVDATSIQRDKATITFSAREIVREHGNPLAMAVKFLQVDCGKRQIGWLGVQTFGYDEKVIDTATRAEAGMTAATDPLDEALLDFACDEPDAREAAGFFPIAIDDGAFTEALLKTSATTLSPRALHHKMAASPSTVVIRSSAPAPATFGKIQTVKTGEPMVPPRDYAKGPQIPNPADYRGNEVGRIYDIAYQGIQNGQLQFEIRGYSIDDLVHPGSGQNQSADPREHPVHINDLAITVVKASPEEITYSVAIEPASAAESP